MSNRIVSRIMLLLLLTNMLILALNIRPVKANGTIYIRADGAIDPPTAPILSGDNITYTLTDNIYDSVVVERSDIIVDGAGYMLKGSGVPLSVGFNLSSVKNVTIQNAVITDFCYGIYLYLSSFNTVSQNKVTASLTNGILLDESSNNSISKNYIEDNEYSGIQLVESSFNTLSENNVTANTFGVMLLFSLCNRVLSENDIISNAWTGIELSESSNNTISGNNMKNNNDGIAIFTSSFNAISNNTISDNRGNGVGLYYSADSNIVTRNNIKNNGNRAGLRIAGSSSNIIYHNNFTDNVEQAHSYESLSVWDDGYPSCGNYWSDYNGTDLYGGPYQNETGSDGIGDAPYVIDENNIDNYPLTSPYISDITINNVIPSRNVICEGYNLNINVTVANQGDYTETFNLTVYANTTLIAVETIALSGENSTTITFIWNTTGFAKGNYIISAHASPVLGEANKADNTLIDGTVTVSIYADVNGDGAVDGNDYQLVKRAIPSTPDMSNWNPNTDIDNDGVIDGLDFQKVKRNIGKQYT